jgi:hypothetical protein
MKFAMVAMSLISASAAGADIVGGVDVQKADPVRKSVAALYDPAPGGQGGALCTASLIGPNTAVTAAHCVTGAGTSKPVLIFGNDVRAPDREIRPVTQVAVNPAWKSHAGKGMDQGDIAVVKFGGQTPEGYYPVPLETTDSNLKKGGKVTLAGYGITNAQTKAGAGVLRKTHVKIANPRRGKSEMVLDQSHGRGACHGDSGGPAFVRSGRQTVLAGVTNRSYPNSAPDDCRHQVVYTKVSSYQPWIQSTESRMNEASRSMKAAKARLARRLPKQAPRIKARRLHQKKYGLASIERAQR